MVIVDMCMPTKCTDCPLYNSDYHYCVVGSYGIPVRYHCDELTERPEWCPIIKECEEVEE